MNVKLAGKKSNRAAIGARIEAVTDEVQPVTIHREVTTGSSFGANPLEQMIGVGKAAKLKTLTIFWPASRTSQIFRDVPVNQAIELTEGAATFRKRDYKPIPLPN